MTSIRRIILTVIITVVCVPAVEVIVLLVFVYSGRYNVAASQPHTGFVRWLLDTTMEQSVRRHADEVQPPGQASAVEGASHFSEMCVTCHGAPGVERSEIGKGLNPQPPQLSQAAPEWSLEEIHWIIRHGIKMTGMPAFGPTHEEEQLWALTYFVKQLPQLSPTQYQDLVAKAEHQEQSGEPPQPESGEHQH